MEMDPTDICTRGLMNRNNLLEWDKKLRSWLLGPDFLTEEHQASEIVYNEIDEENTEIKKKNMLVAAAFNKQLCFEYKKFSSYQRIIRVICWMKRYC